jgi:hypothetical protein
VNLRDLPPAARAVAAAITTAVAAAAARDAAELRPAAAELSLVDNDTALGQATRFVLEDLHPDGLDGDDIRAVLEQCTKSALDWLPETDPHVLLVVLAGALGIHPGEHEGVVRPTRVELALHAPVLLAHLLTGSGKRLEPYLTRAFTEIARTETMD